MPYRPPSFHDTMVLILQKIRLHSTCFMVLHASRLIMLLGSSNPNALSSLCPLPPLPRPSLASHALLIHYTPFATTPTPFAFAIILYSFSFAPPLHLLASQLLLPSLLLFLHPHFPMSSLSIRALIAVVVLSIHLFSRTSW